MRRRQYCCNQQMRARRVLKKDSWLFVYGVGVGYVSLHALISSCGIKANFFAVCAMAMSWHEHAFFLLLYCNICCAIFLFDIYTFFYIIFFLLLLSFFFCF